MPLIIEGSQPVIITETVEQRKEVIEDCQELYKKYEDAIVELDSEYHKKYLDYAFNNKLPPQMKALDPSQPWILYWVANGLRTMNESWLEEDYQSRIQEKLFASSTTCGPFGGGYGQLPHLASNYAGIEALLLCNNAAACWDRINKKAIYDWFLSLKVPNGGFKTALTVGEVDARGVYTALSVASLLGLLTDELIEGCTEFIVGCQTYEGGFGSCPQEDEAHGGYTFCAVASLAILNGLDSIDIPKLMKWCSARQFNEEKGFSGRTNKLVDGCYSFWVGGTAAILEAYGYGECIDKESLQEYILKCCQPDDRPGLRDKPGKPPDYYHTNYVLLGLAVAQYSFICTGTATTIECSPIVSDPAVSPINPVYGLPTKDIDLFRDYLKMNT